MAKKALVIKQKKEPKYPVRKYNRCALCGRTNGFIRKYQTCRICFRELVLKGELAGVKKSSW